VDGFAAPTFRREADAHAHGFRKSFQSARRGQHFAAFQAGNNGLSRSHCLGDQSALDSNAAMPHNLFVSNPMLSIVETSAFVRRAENLLSTEEHEEMLFYLALHPLAGDEIPGTGGVRKVRFAARGKGKSGGVRVIYYFYDEENPLYAIFLYGKNEQANLTPKQKREVTTMAATIKAAAKVRRIRE
jgi:mRNA-degrading endonuclease RelE of RelBE toxin-antitoxin system